MAGRLAILSGNTRHDQRLIALLLLTHLGVTVIGRQKNTCDVACGLYICRQGTRLTGEHNKNTTRTQRSFSDSRLQFGKGYSG